MIPNYKSQLYRLAIKSTRYMKDRLASLEFRLYKRLPYQPIIKTVLPYSKRAMQISVTGEISRIIYLDGLLGYEGHSTAMWGQLCGKADLIVDIGAHIGVYSILAADIAASAQIHAIEPLPENHAILLRNIESSGYQNKIIAHQVALSNSSGKGQLFIKGSSGSTLEQNFWLDSPSLNQETVPIETLDIWAMQNLIPISASSLLKLDVETHEPNVLNGAKDAISAGSAMLCEVLGTFTEHKLNDILPASQWRYFWIGPDGPVERRRIIGDPNWKFPNYVFLPEGSPFEEVVQNFVQSRGS